MDHDVFGMMIAERDRKIANLEFKLYSNPALLAPAPGVDLCDDGEDLVEVFEHGEDLVEFIERTAAENTKDFAAAKERWEAKYRGASLTPIKPWDSLDVMEKLKLMGQERDRREQAASEERPPHSVVAAKAQDAIHTQIDKLWEAQNELANVQTKFTIMSRPEKSADQVIDETRTAILAACTALKEAANALDAG